MVGEDEFVEVCEHAEEGRRHQVGRIHGNGPNEGLEVRLGAKEVAEAEYLLFVLELDIGNE